MLLGFTLGLLLQPALKSSAKLLLPLGNILGNSNRRLFTSVANSRAAAINLFRARKRLGLALLHLGGFGN